MTIWYEIEDALDVCVTELETRIHGQCRFEVWEWYASSEGKEAGLVGRFPTRALAEHFICSMNEQVHRLGRGGIYPKCGEAAPHEFDEIYEEPRVLSLH